jgi:ribosomal protein S6
MTKWQKHGTDRAGIFPDAKREYETIYILRPDITNEAVGAVNTKIRGVIEAGGGTLLKVENWGKRRLAYEVQEADEGDVPLLLVPRHRRAGRGSRAQPAPHRLGHPHVLGEDRRERRRRRRAPPR